MTTIVTRSGKGSSLTHTEVDANFTNLNADKLELAGGTMSGSLVLNADPTAGLQATTKQYVDTTTATAAQGTLADSAVQPNDNPTFAGLTTTANVSFGDNDKAIFGAGSDLQIYHDGTHSWIKDAGTGDLTVSGDNLYLEKGDGTKFLYGVSSTGQVRLYYGDNQKFITTSTGVSITGALTLSGTVDGRDVAADGTKLDGIEAGATSDQTAAQLLTAIKTVDGAGSGLDADTLDGLSEATFMRRSANSQLDMNNNDIVGVDQIFHEGDSNTYIQFHAPDQWRVVTGGVERLEVNNSQITSTEPIHAPSFHGDGSSLTGIAAGAGAGGGGSDEIFWENGQSVTSNYTITNGKNAMSAGPITIDSGVTVTVGAGETWTVV